MPPLPLTRNDAGLGTSRISPQHNLRDKAVPTAHTVGTQSPGTCIIYTKHQVHAAA